MKTLRAILARCGGLFRRRKLEVEMNEELRGHLEALVERNLAAGMAPDEAQAAARRSFGGLAQIQERARDERRSAWGEHFAQDLRYAARQARRHPGFAAVVILILGLGFGANVAVFSALEVLLFRPLPLPAPEELVVVTNVRAAGAGEAVASPYLSLALFEGLRDHAQSLDGVLMLNGSGGSRDLRVPGPAGDAVVRVRTSDVSGSYFPVLRVRPLLGRLIAVSDDVKGAPRAVAVISHAFWQRQFGGDRAAIGRTVFIEKVAFEIIGVAPEGFGGVKIGEPIEVWTPLWMLPAVNPRFGTNLQQPNWNGLFLMGRLASGRTRAAAEAEIDLLFQQRRTAAQPEVPESERARRWGRIVLESGAGGVAGDARSRGGPILSILLAVVVLVQVIACANIASLSLARLAARQRELAARTTLGASRGRILRQLLTEALLLVAGGGVLGALLVQWGFFAARTQGIEVRPNGWILLFGAVLLTVTGLIVALVPALKSSRIDLATALKGQAGTVASGSSWLQRALVVVQLAVCGCLLTGTGYFVRTLQQLRAVDLGFGAEKLLIASVGTPAEYEARRRSGVVQELLAALNATPGVSRATYSVTGMLSGGTAQGPIAVTGYVPQPNEDMAMRYVFAGPHYFETVGLPLVRGRGLEPVDFARATSSTVAKAVVNEAMARRYFGETDPIGRHFQWGRDDYEIVGVARDAKYRSLREEHPLICYLPWAALSSPLVSLQIRIEGEPRAFAAHLPDVVRRIDPNARVLQVQTIADVIGQATREEAMTALGVGAFSALALLLTSLGLYGLLAYGVAQRTREIGVRMALGGQARDIVALILKQGLALAVVGWSAGVLAALALMRLVASRLYGVSGVDPLALAGSGALLAAVAAAACWFPARRATKIDPMIALRAE